MDAVNSHTPEEILSVKKAIETRLNQVTEIYNQQPMEPNEDDIINTSTAIGVLEDEIGKVGSFPSVPDPSQCCVNGLVVPYIGTGREKKMSVVLKDETSIPIPRKCPFLYQLRKVGEDPDEYIPPRVTVTHSDNGTATLAFTPRQLGEYELTILIRNRPIANPFKIIARQSRDYSDFQDMQVTYKNIGSQCCGIAVHDNGTVYASNSSINAINVFKPNGEETQIGSSDNAGGQLSNPWGTALIGDTIYVVSHGNHTVKMYLTDGRYIGEFGGYGDGTGQLNSPRGICTDGKGRVLVADQGNNQIQIFTSQGDFIQSIRCSTNPPNDVAVDPEGNIHAALHYNNHIAIYSKDGKLLDTYDLEGTLQSPTTIYIDGEGNRLIGTYSGAVHIADPTGTLIATRQVDSSYAVTMDKNGIIYVAEYNYNRVSII